MVTFYSIRDNEKFFSMIDNCIGRVSLESSDGQVVDIRKNTLIRELLSMSCSGNGIEKLTLTIENRLDMPRIRNYLMECDSKPSLKQMP